MTQEKPYRRLPLRDLLTDAEKRSRDLAEHIGNTLVARLTDLRDLSRPLRRKSHYPTLLALHNSLLKALEGDQETVEQLDYLERQLVEIQEHARRERLNRN
jgi:C4-dicarboxylate-specific signal transduction histidine kinase